MEKLRAAVEAELALFARLEGLVADDNSGEAMDREADEALLRIMAYLEKNKLKMVDVFSALAFCHSLRAGTPS